MSERLKEIHVGFRGNDNMKLLLLSVISVTALAALASTGVDAQRGLTAGPSGDRSSPPADLVVAQKETSLEPGEIFRDCRERPELGVVPPGAFLLGSRDKH